MLTRAAAHERHGGDRERRRRRKASVEVEEEDPRQRRRRERAPASSSARGPRSSRQPPRRHVGSARPAGLLVGARYASIRPASSSAPEPPVPASGRSGSAPPHRRDGLSEHGGISGSGEEELEPGGAPVVEMGTGLAEEKDEESARLPTAEEKDEGARLPTRCKVRGRCQVACGT
ncbi:unnamed protein product [Miscanthus lutarioriparius]|uniref:Uncharacterized protein n=1 Tax=Miscanthus lutarioriparius TaxID=422564 RepID=A0A811SHS1_9POAL|nr:unnamed protein product [Miscanthus lutarioriparius]